MLYGPGTPAVLLLCLHHVPDDGRSLDASHTKESCAHWHACLATKKGLKLISSSPGKATGRISLKNQTFGVI